MQSIENIKKLGLKENRLFLVLVIWLLIGDIVIQFSPIIGIIIFLPFLTFLLFLYFFTLVLKKDLRGYPIWKAVVYFIISLPIMVILALILVILFLASIISYIFFTSWFILFGAYLVSKRLDENMHKSKVKTLSRGIEYFGGILLAFFLLGGFLGGTVILGMYIDFKANIFFLFVFIIVTVIILILLIVSTGYFFRKTFNAWLGPFLIVVALYTFFLALKIFLGLSSSGGSSSVYIQIALLVFDIGIIVYSISTILGSQAELLADKLKYFTISNILVWLIFSKAAYEFAVNFPYKDILGLPIPYIDYIVGIGSNLTLIRNIAVMGFFVLLLLFLGIYEIIKYGIDEKKKKEMVDVMESELSPELLKSKAFKELLRKEDFDQLNQLVTPEILDKLANIEKTYEFKRISLNKMLLRTMRADLLKEAVDKAVEEKADIEKPEEEQDKKKKKKKKKKEKDEVIEKIEVEIIKETDESIETEKPEETIKTEETKETEESSEIEQSDEVEEYKKKKKKGKKKEK
jgi:hypothetical protein